MRCKYLHDPVFLSLRENEETALRLWSSTLRRGASAVRYKNLPAAELYLSSAFEIALLRLDCAGNRLFSVAHFLQPAELLIELLLHNNPARAHSLFSEIQHLLQSRGLVLAPPQERVMQEISDKLLCAQRLQTPAPVEMPAQAKRSVPRRDHQPAAVATAQSATS